MASNRTPGAGAGTAGEGEDPLLTSMLWVMSFLTIEKAGPNESVCMKEHRSGHWVVSAESASASGALSYTTHGQWGLEGLQHNTQHTNAARAAAPAPSTPPRPQPRARQPEPEAAANATWAAGAPTHERTDEGDGQLAQVKEPVGCDVALGVFHARKGGQGGLE